MNLLNFQNMTPAGKNGRKFCFGEAHLKKKQAEFESAPAASVSGDRQPPGDLRVHERILHIWNT
jgi:hypothetical protein